VVRKKSGAGSSKSLRGIKGKLKVKSKLRVTSKKIVKGKGKSSKVTMPLKKKTSAKETPRERTSRGAPQAANKLAPNVKRDMKAPLRLAKDRAGVKPQQGKEIQVRSSGSAAKKIEVVPETKPVKEVVKPLVKPLTKEPKKGADSDKEALAIDRDIIVGDLDDGLQELSGFEVGVEVELADIDSSIDLAERGDIETRISRLIELGKEKGYITMEEVNEALAGEVMSEEQVDEVIARFGEHDIDIIEQPAEPQEDAGEGPMGLDAAPEVLEPGSLGRSTDPVRQYLREMGNVSLLTREGEVEIAKRIESGLLAVREQLLQQPLALDYVVNLFDRVKNDEIRLRDLFAEDDSEQESEKEEE